MDPLIGVLVALIAAAFAGEFCTYVHIPRVVGHISAGIMLGTPSAQQLLIGSQGIEVLSYFAEIGAILLMFFAGLEVNFRAFVRDIKIASGISIGNTLLPLMGGYATSHYIFGLDSSISLIVGIGLSVSAIAISCDVLEELSMLKTRLGSLVISAGAVDDVYELGLITIALGLVETMGAQVSLFTLMQNALLFVVFVILFRIIITPVVLRVVEKKTEVTLLMSGIILTFFMGVVSDFFGFGAFIGALISGIIVRQTLLSDVEHHRPWEAGLMSRNVHMIAFGFFVPLFFVHAGTLTNILSIWENLSFSITITIIAIIGTVIGTAIAYYIFSKKSWHEGILLGWALNAKGDTEIVIAKLALGVGVINSAIFSSLIFMAVVSTLVSPIVFRRLLKSQKSKKLKEN